MIYYVIVLAAVILIAANHIANTVTLRAKQVGEDIRELHTAMVICSDELKGRLSEDPDGVRYAIDNVEEKLRQIAEAMPIKWDAKPEVSVSETHLANESAIAWPPELEQITDSLREIEGHISDIAWRVKNRVPLPSEIDDGPFE